MKHGKKGKPKKSMAVTIVFGKPSPERSKARRKAAKAKLKKKSSGMDYS
tara:strand:- start:1987 stop:2133 length:147 start_codon:yes stop_codon:yes gene_type:complete